MSGKLPIDRAGLTQDAPRIHERNKRTVAAEQAKLSLTTHANRTEPLDSAGSDGDNNDTRDCGYA
jgi:hypothetical protein